MATRLENLTATRLIPKIDKAFAYEFNVLGNRLSVSALGTVSSSGWSNLHLSPIYYVHPPADGYWEFNFLGDPPFGPSLQVMLPVAAAGLFPCPDWVRGVRVKGRSGNAEAAVERAEIKPADFKPELLNLSEDRSHALVEQTIAVFDDSFQPVGFCGGFHVKMKKLRHELVLIVEGPDEGRIRHCINEAAAAGLIAAIVAAFVTGGAALQAAIAAFLGRLEQCLGASMAKIENRSHWIEWCT